MAGGPELLPIVEGESVGGTPRLQIGPQCCCTQTIDCSGLAIPEFFGVEFHGTVSDPGGDKDCGDVVSGLFGTIRSNLYYRYAPNLFNWFGEIIEVEYQNTVLGVCYWCNPVASPLVRDNTNPADYTSHVPCSDVTGSCTNGGMLYLGGFSEGYQSLKASSMSVPFDCNADDCSQESGTTGSFTLITHGIYTDGPQVSFSNDFTGVTVTVTMQINAYQSLLRDYTTVYCPGPPPTPDDVAHDCWAWTFYPHGGLITYQRTFPAGSVWADIKDQQIPCLIDPFGMYYTGTTCAPYTSDFPAIEYPNHACIVNDPIFGFTQAWTEYSIPADLVLPRVKVTGAYCILREI